MISIGKIRLDFVCVRDVGRSQMAAAFAERERAERGLEDIVETHSGGTDPADTVHEEVVEAMAEVGVDIADQAPTYVADLNELKDLIIWSRWGVPSRNSAARSMASNHTSEIS